MDKSVEDLADATVEDLAKRRRKELEARTAQAPSTARASGDHSTESSEPDEVLVFTVSPSVEPTGCYIARRPDDVVSKPVFPTVDDVLRGRITPDRCKRPDVMKVIRTYGSDVHPITKARIFDELVVEGWVDEAAAYGVISKSTVLKVGVDPALGLYRQEKSPGVGPTD